MAGFVLGLLIVKNTMSGSAVKLGRMLTRLKRKFFI